MNPPDLAQYDVLLINTSGGKDSQAMLDHVVELADDAGVRNRLVAVHADLGRMEWPGTRELAEEQVRHYGLRFEVVSRRTRTGQSQTLLEQVEQRGMWPASTSRYCTSDHKRGPITTLYTRLVAELRQSDPRRHVQLLNMLGLRAQESTARALKPALVINERASNGRRTVTDWLPLHDWSEQQVWDRIRASGVRHHPAYDLGMPRLSCRFCVLASTSALVRSAQLNPELAAEYAAVETRINHTFRKDLSMAQIIERARTAPVTAVEDWAA